MGDKNREGKLESWNKQVKCTMMCNPRGAGFVYLLLSQKAFAPAPSGAGAPTATVTTDCLPWL